MRSPKLGQRRAIEDSTESVCCASLCRRCEAWNTGMKPKDRPELPERIADEPGWEDRFQRGLQRALNTPHQPRTKEPRKPRERAASKGRVHKGKE